MSPWIETTRSKWPLYLGVALITFGMVVGYLMMTGAVGGEGAEDARAAQTPGPVSSVGPSQPDPADSSDAAAPAALDVVSWGHASDQLAVVVRNETDKLIEGLRVRITAVDDDGDTLMSTTGTAADVCCTIVGLPPKGYFGLFAPADEHLAAQIAEVEVEPADSEVPADAPMPTRVRVEHASLERLPHDAVVTARLTTSQGSGLSGYVAAQAFLVRPNGRVAQVISGRFYCFGPGQSREVRMELLHPAPPGLRLDLVVAYAFPAGVPAHVSWDCR